MRCRRSARFGRCTRRCGHSSAGWRALIRGGSDGTKYWTTRCGRRWSCSTAPGVRLLGTRPSAGRTPRIAGRRCRPDRTRPPNAGTTTRGGRTRPLQRRRASRRMQHLRVPPRGAQPSTCGSTAHGEALLFKTTYAPTSAPRQAARNVARHKGLSALPEQAGPVLEADAHVVLLSLQPHPDLCQPLQRRICADRRPRARGVRRSRTGAPPAAGRR